MLAKGDSSSRSYARGQDQGKMSTELGRDRLRIAQLLQAERRHLGSITRLADRLRVSAKTVQEWLKKSESELRRLHPDNIDQIVEVAQSVGLETVQFVDGPTLWDIKRSYQENLAAPVPPAPHPLRPFLDHKIGFLGFQLNSPIGIGDSVFTANAARVKFWADSGAAVLTYKTVRSYESPALWPPNVYLAKNATPMLERLPSNGVEIEVSESVETSLALNGVVSRFLCPSPAPGLWQADFRTAQQHLQPGQLLILSVIGGQLDADSERDILDDWRRVAELAVAAGAKVIELNVSHPASGIATNIDSLPTPKKICAAVRNSVGNAKLLLKIAPLDGEALRNLVLSTVGEGLCDGITAINSVGALPFYMGPAGSQSLFDGKEACLSGRPILGLGLRCVHELALIRDRENLRGMGIVGAGGVTTEQDFMAYLHAGSQQIPGADVVQLASACFYDTYTPFKLRKFYDDQARQSAPAEDLEQDAMLMNMARAARLMEQEEGVTSQGRERILLAAQEEMLEWLRRPERMAALGPLRALRPKPAPAIEDCIRLIRLRLAHR